MNQGTPQRSERYVFVDALRGIAAVAVLFHHAVTSTVMAGPLEHVLPRFALWTGENAKLGVQIFFVISGFVITLSLRATQMRSGEIANFAIRRQLRLDPPYFTVLAFCLMQWAIERSVPSLVTPPVPRLQEIVANVLYLQNVLGVPSIVPVAWTLCIEIQFYVAFVVLLWVCSLGTPPRTPRATIATAAVTITGLISVFLRGTQLAPWFIFHWHHFAAGALCLWSLRTRDRAPTVGLAMLLAGTTVAGFVIPNRVGDSMAGIVTTLAIFAVGRAGRLTDMLGHSVFQYLGRVSYSLYLVHFAILLFVARAGFKVTHENRWAAIAWMIFACLLSIGVADVFYRLIERPSMRLASTFKRTRTTEREILVTAAAS